MGNAHSTNTVLGIAIVLCALQIAGCSESKKTLESRAKLRSFIKKSDASYLDKTRISHKLNSDHKKQLDEILKSASVVDVQIKYEILDEFNFEFNDAKGDTAKRNLCIMRDNDKVFLAEFDDHLYYGKIDSKAFEELLTDIKETNIKLKEKDNQQPPGS